MTRLLSSMVLSHPFDPPLMGQPLHGPSHRHHQASAVAPLSQKPLPGNRYQEERFSFCVPARAVALEVRRKACPALDHSRSRPFDRYVAGVGAVLGVEGSPVGPVWTSARLDKRTEGEQSWAVECRLCFHSAPL